VKAFFVEESFEKTLIAFLDNSKKRLNFEEGSCFFNNVTARNKMIEIRNFQGHE